MKNWKTTVGGLVSVLGVTLPHFGLSKELADAIVIIGVAILGFFAKDHSVSGTGI